MFDNWAQPVVSKRWAATAVFLDRIKRMTGYRSSRLAHWAHRSWERACGIA